MSEQEFETLTGRKPENDDMDRVNCPDAGKDGHRQCGVCPKCGMPKMDGCYATCVRDTQFMDINEAISLLKARWSDSKI